MMHFIYVIITNLFLLCNFDLSYRNWLVLLLRRLVMMYYQPSDQQQTVQAQVLLNVYWNIFTWVKSTLSD